MPATNKAIVRVSYAMLEEILGWRDKAAIVCVIPPSPADLQKQSCTMVVEGVDFPPNFHGMALPELYAVYQTGPTTHQFKGFEFVGEPKELPPDFLRPRKPGGPAPAIRGDAPTGEAPDPRFICLDPFRQQPPGQDGDADEPEEVDE